jgi:hypothetical protein
MLSARSLEIFGADDILSWYWTDRSDSRFTLNFSICVILIVVYN